MAAETTTLTTVKNQRCHPPAPARKLNAAPVLCMRTMLKNGVTTSTSPGAKAPLTHALVARSAATTAALTASQRVQPRALTLGMAPRFARPIEVGYAAGADTGTPRIDAHVVAIMPTALALGVGARDHLHVDAVARTGAHCGLRRDQHEPEIVAERVEEPAVGLAHGELGLGLQRRADAALGADLLQPPGHRGADLADALPLRGELVLARLLGQHVVPCVQEHAVGRVAVGLRIEERP